jgi:hypothetical protein
LGIDLLAGRWQPTERGMLDSTHLRFFTRETLERMFERCGWKVVARDDFEAIRSDQYNSDLNELLPLEMVGALRSMADALNPTNAVQQFVWALTPFPVANPPESFLEAVTPEGVDLGAALVATDAEADIRRYLSSVGLLASEQSRRYANELQRRRNEEIRWRKLEEKARQATPADEEEDLDSEEEYLPLWKQWALDIVYHSPRSSAVFQKLYRRIR